MSLNWRDWCRLCARNDDAECEDFLIAEAIVGPLVQKFFLISLPSYNDVPSNPLCTDCFRFIMKLEKFAERCVKVNKMFSDLLNKNFNVDVTDLNKLRLSYGIGEDAKPTTTVAFRNTLKPIINVDIPSDIGIQAEVFKVKEEEEVPLGNENIKYDSQFSDAQEEEALRGIKNDHFQLNCEKDTQNNIQKTVLEKKRLKRKMNKNGNEKSKNEDKDSEADICNDVDNNISDDNEHVDLVDELKDLFNNNDRVNIKLKTYSRKSTKRKNNEIEEQITCQLCAEVFDRQREYKLHMTSKHNTDEPKTQFICSKCPKFFSSDKKRKLHEIVHLPDNIKKIHPCIYCGKKFSKVINVQAHVRAVHIGDKPFICEECGKAFGTNGALKEHQITHSDEHPYQCSYCSKKFKSLPRLKTHLDIHKDTAYVCPHCGIQLNTKQTLKRHMVVHSDQKKYKCNYCGNEYKRSKTLKNHLILHTGLRPYICPFCDKSFANGSNCRSHKKKAHPIELAAMEAAGEVYPTKNMQKLGHFQPKKYEIQTTEEPAVSKQHNISNNIEHDTKGNHKNI